MTPHAPGAPEGSRSKSLAVRVTPELARAVRIRVAELDISLQDYVTSALEMALKTEIDPRPRR